MTFLNLTDYSAGTTAKGKFILGPNEIALAVAALQSVWFIYTSISTTKVPETKSIQNMQFICASCGQPLRLKVSRKF